MARTLAQILALLALLDLGFSKHGATCQSGSGLDLSLSDTFNSTIMARREVLQDDAKISVASLQQMLAQDKVTFVSGEDLWALLAARGAHAGDVSSLAALWCEAMPQQNEHGRDVYPFKANLKHAN
jgi:hypothetical protein